MKYLLVIDVQKEFKDKNGRYEKCLKYIKESNYDGVFGVFFKNENENFEKHLNYTDCKDASEKSIEYKALRIIEKNGYSMFNSMLFSKNDKNDTVDIIGCDAEGCVMANAFVLWDMGINFNLLTEYIYTTSDFSLEETFKRMKYLFGDCVKE